MESRLFRWYIRDKMGLQTTAGIGAVTIHAMRALGLHDLLVATVLRTRPEQRLWKERWVHYAQAVCRAYVPDQSLTEFDEQEI